MLYGHVFRNAMLLIVAGFPPAFIGILFTSALLVEIVFSLDGLGLLGFQSVRSYGRLANAARCAGAVPASGVSMSALPSWAAAAPAARDGGDRAPGRDARRSATSGRSTARRTSASSGEQPEVAGRRRRSNEPRWPPASTPWTTSASAPASRASRASAGVVTVTHIAQPGGVQSVHDDAGRRAAEGERHDRHALARRAARAWRPSRRRRGAARRAGAP